MTVFFNKAGLFYEKWNAEKRKNVRRRVKKMTAWTHLRDACEIEDGVTLLDIFHTVDQYKMLKMFISQYSWCAALGDFHAQAEEPDLSGEEEDPDEAMTHLEIYWHADYSQFSKDPAYIELSPSFHGIGKPTAEEMGHCQDGKKYWGIDFSPMYKLADLPVKLDTGVEFFKPRDYKPGRKPIIKAERSFSLEDVLDAIYWEISFHGDPQGKRERLEELKERVDSIKDGTAKLIPADEVFKDLGLEEDEMIYENVFPNVMLIHGFYSPEDCQAELEYAEAAGWQKQHYGGGARPEARYRAVKDDAVRAAQIWERIHFFPSLEQFYKDLRPDPYEDFARLAEGHTFWSPIGLNERLRYYKYEPGHRFDTHFDIMFRLDDNTRTFLTFIIYLNCDFEGGETRFEGLGTVKPRLGTLLVFPHELKHEGMEVTKGVKTVLRSDIMYRLDND